jgi:diguanylate cyclase (GGDEF)-like protein
MLTELARRITDVMRPTDTFARLGGDEFALVCEDLATVKDVETIAERMVGAVDQPWTLNGRPIRTGVSIGITVTDRSDALPADLIRAADAAMYRAKRIAGSAWVLDSGLPLAGTRV